MANSQQDTASSTDSGFDYLNSPSLTLKRRTFANIISTSNRSSGDRLMNNSTMKYSDSTNGLCDTMRQDTSDSLELPSLARQTKPTFDLIPDLQTDNNNFIIDDHQNQYQRKSNLTDSIPDDLQSNTSSEKSRKQIISTKLLKPFQNMRLRKKSGGT